MTWLAVLAAAMLVLAAAGAALLLAACGRRSAPDFWDEGWLLRSGLGDRREEVLSGKAWAEKRRLLRVEVSSDDEHMLRGLLLSRKNAKGTVLLMHDCRSDWRLDFPAALRFFYGRGYQVLLAEERAHGNSRGLLCTRGIWERFDVRAWCNFLNLRYMDRHPIFICGQGMGGAAALMAASLDLPGNVRGIIAIDAWDSPYRHLERVWEEQVSFLAWAGVWLLDRAASLLAGFSLREYSAGAGVRETEYPVLLVRGTANRLIPEQETMELLRACRGEKRLLRVEGAGDGRCWQGEGGKLLRRTLAAFLERHNSQEVNDYGMDNDPG